MLRCWGKLRLVDLLDDIEEPVVGNLEDLSSSELLDQRSRNEAKLKLLAFHAPHLYKHKFYKWSRKVFESVNPMTFLSAGNQAGKSTVMIMKNIHWITDVLNKPKRWPKVYASGNEARSFWYFYPDKSTVAEEVDEKWRDLLVLDRKDSPYYAVLERENRSYNSIHFVNCRSRIYFKTYNQMRDVLQSRTVYHITLDEEPLLRPGNKNIFSELAARMSSTHGYFLVGFTATHSQEFFSRIMEERGKNELYKGAMKVHARLYDCLEYEDGDKNTPWNRASIKRFERTLMSDGEIQKRVYGRFVRGAGVVYSGFSAKRNVVEDLSIPGDWEIFGSVDIGSGGDRDAAAVIFLAKCPVGRGAKVIGGWKGPLGLETGTGYIFREYMSLRAGIVRRYRRSPVVQVYDSAVKEFEILARERGEVFHKANKKLSDGVGLVNTLFQYGMLTMCNLEELDELQGELYNYVHDSKAARVNDFCDALRYAVMIYPHNWDFSVVSSEGEFDVDLDFDDNVEIVGISDHPLNACGMYDDEDFGRLERCRGFLNRRGFSAKVGYGDKKGMAFGDRVLSDYRRNLSKRYGIGRS